VHAAPASGLQRVTYVIYVGNDIYAPSRHLRVCGHICVAARRCHLCGKWHLCSAPCTASSRGAAKRRAREP